MPEVRIDEREIFFLEFGDPTSPPLVLLHGLYGDSSTMLPLAEAFASRFRVMVPDALGHGRSARPAEFDLEDQGRAVTGLVAARIGGPTALLGVSMGSYVAAQAAILAPDLVSRLVLVVSKAHGLTSSSAAYAQRMGFDLSTATQEEITVILAGAMWSPDTPESRREELLAAQAETPPVPLEPAERLAIECSLAGFDLRPSLGRITVPTLVVSGRADGLNPPEAGEELAALLPDARFHIYEHSGHMLAAEEFDRLVVEATEFCLG